MNKVELHHAFLWTCDVCGRDNIQVVEKVDLRHWQDLMEKKDLPEDAEPLDEEELEDDEIEGELILDVIDEHNGSVTFHIYREMTSIYPIPCQVTCRYCKSSFEAVLEGMDDLD